MKHSVKSVFDVSLAVMIQWGGVAFVCRQTAFHDLGQDDTGTICGNESENII